MYNNKFTEYVLQHKAFLKRNRNAAKSLKKSLANRYNLAQHSYDKLTANRCKLFRQLIKKYTWGEDAL